MRVDEDPVCDWIVPALAIASRESKGDRVDGEVTTVEVAAKIADEANSIWSTRIAARTVEAERRHLSYQSGGGRDANGAEAILVARVGEVRPQRVRGCVGGKVPIDGWSTGNDVAQRAADHIRGKPSSSKSSEKLGDVGGNGGADRRLEAHAPLAAAPSPMKRKSRQAA